MGQYFPVAYGVALIASALIPPENRVSLLTDLLFIWVSFSLVSVVRVNALSLGTLMLKSTFSFRWAGGRTPSRRWNRPACIRLGDLLVANLLWILDVVFIMSVLQNSCLKVTRQNWFTFCADTLKIWISESEIQRKFTERQSIYSATKRIQSKFASL